MKCNSGCICSSKVLFWCVWCAGLLVGRGSFKFNIKKIKEEGKIKGRKGINKNTFTENENIWNIKYGSDSKFGIIRNAITKSL